MNQARLPAANESQHLHNPEISQTFVGFNRLGDKVAKIYDNCTPRAAIQPNLTAMLNDPLIETIHTLNPSFKFNVFHNGRDKAPLQYTFDYYPRGIGESRVPAHRLGANIPYARKDPDTQEIMAGYAQLAYTWNERPANDIPHKIREEAELADMPPKLFEIVCEDILRIDSALRNAQKTRATRQKRD